MPLEQAGEYVRDIDVMGQRCFVAASWLLAPFAPLHFPLLLAI